MPKLMDYDNANPNKKTPKEKTKLTFGRKDYDHTNVDWTDIAHDLLLGILYRVPLAGGAVMFGKSRDGGILILRVYHDSVENTPIYIRPQNPDDIATLVEIYDVFGAKVGLPSWS